jgi:hypothetical protein
MMKGINEGDSLDTPTDYDGLYREFVIRVPHGYQVQECSTVSKLFQIPVSIHGEMIYIRLDKETSVRTLLGLPADVV